MYVDTMTEILKRQLRAVIMEHEAALERSAHSDASDVLSISQVEDLRTRCIAAIERASVRDSAYRARIEAIDQKTWTHDYERLASCIGVARALLSDIENSYVSSLEELLRGDVFGDFLEMAQHLVDNGYKDAAAVVAGSTLEVHLRNLCNKHSLSPVGSGGKPKKADLLNAELTKVGAYSKIYQKNVTAWLSLRNHAAHGDYEEYSREQVALLVASIRDFLTKHPA